jgi:hypothetical protein
MTNLDEMNFVDVQAEMAALASMIYADDAIGIVCKLLDSSCFSKPEHRHIFDAIIALHKEGTGIDLITITDELKRRNRLKAAGGADYIVQIADTVCTGANAEYHSKIVREKAVRRRWWYYTESVQNILKDGLSIAEIESIIRQDAAEIFAETLDDATVNLLCCSDIQTSEVEWLWPNRLPLGMFSLIVGDPGVGKSFLSVYLSAVVSTGRDWPDGTPSKNGSIFLFCDEDDFGKVVVPRLKTNGADIAKVYCLNEITGPDSIFNITNPENLRKLESAIKKVGDCRLIILDPITAYLDGVNANSNAEVRAALSGIVRLAQKTAVSVIGISQYGLCGSSKGRLGGCEG